MTSRSAVPLVLLVLLSALSSCAREPDTAEESPWVEREGVEYVSPGIMRNPRDPDELAIAMVPIFPDGYRAAGVEFGDAPRAYATAWVPRSVPEPLSSFKKAARTGAERIFGRPILYAATDEVREMLRNDEVFRSFVSQHVSVDALMESRFRVTKKELKTNRYDQRLVDVIWRDVEGGEETEG